MRDTMRLLIIPILVVLAAAGWTGYWFFAVDQVESAIENWIAQQTARGAEVSYASIDYSGYPFRIRVDVSRPHLAMPQHPAQPDWQADTISAISHPWTPRHVVFELNGLHRFSHLANGERKTWRLNSPQALASWTAESGGWLQRLSIDLHGMALQEDGVERLRAGRLQLHLRPVRETEPALDIAASAENAVVKWPLPPAFVPEIALARTQFSVSGTVQPDLAPPLALAAWRDDGGIIDVRSLALDWGDISLRGEGTLALDEEMRPMGALTTQLRGYEVLLNAARDDGQITEGAARAAAAVLRLLAAANSGTLSVPVRLQGGEAFLGPVKIARLSPLFPTP